MGRYQPKEHSVAYYDLGEVGHEFDETGNHRLTYGGSVGNWEIYGEICKLERKGIWFAGTTEYFWGILPEIFVIHSLKEHDIEELKHNGKKKILSIKEIAALKGDD